MLIQILIYEGADLDRVDQDGEGGDDVDHQLEQTKLRHKDQGGYHDLASQNEDEIVQHRWHVQLELLKDARDFLFLSHKLLNREFIIKFLSLNV